ncbi:thiamine phosphate synthase [Flavobacterium oncorhynchi]|uniref:Thiamine phosphate synthase n=1 Tax=Flavobacterium oncorhynchi TaxID=728056 RepID=A0A226I9T0_9FLAO|nr:thiamine phosphate synthase [Flavobacterium oncorhynchi]OXB03076.1 thiamine phosphate synthase [Flavobacterium oncorhynchi]
MIVITNPSFIKDEIDILHSLFEEGMSLLHIRKPDYSECEMAQFIQQIKLEYRTKLVLHNHHQLADDLGIIRFHFSEKERKNQRHLFSKFSDSDKDKNEFISTSTHSIDDFNSLENGFDYAFLSPVFKSISKENYESKIDLFEALKSRTNYKTKIIALGGIHSENIRKTLENGFDNIALLGAVWSNINPVKEFKLCQQIVLSHLQ